MRASGRSPNTLLQYRYALGQLEEALAQGRPETTAPESGPAQAHLELGLASVTRAEAVAVIEAWRFRWSPGGVALRLRVLKAFYNHLIRDEVIERSPFKGVAVKVQERPRPTASDEDVEAMIASAANPRDRCIVVLLADTGARKGEIAALRLHDVDLQSGVLTSPRRRPARGWSR
jgi:integrase